MDEGGLENLLSSLPIVLVGVMVNGHPNYSARGKKGEMVVRAFDRDSIVAYISQRSFSIEYYG